MPRIARIAPRDSIFPFLPVETTVEDPFVGSYAGMRGEMERRGIYGNEVFAGKLKKAYKKEEMIKPTGRPKKEPK